MKDLQIKMKRKSKKQKSPDLNRYVVLDDDVVNIPFRIIKNNHNNKCIKYHKRRKAKPANLESKSDPQN